MARVAANPPQEEMHRKLKNALEAVYAGRPIQLTPSKFTFKLNELIVKIYEDGETALPESSAFLQIDLWPV